MRYWTACVAPTLKPRTPQEQKECQILVVGRLSELAPRQITIESRDPATLARDLPDLLAVGYRIEEMTLVDLVSASGDGGAAGKVEVGEASIAAHALEKIH